MHKQDRTTTTPRGETLRGVVFVKRGISILSALVPWEILCFAQDDAYPCNLLLQKKRRELTLSTHAFDFS